MLSKGEIEQILREREVGELYEGKVKIGNSWHLAFWYFWDGKVFAYVKMSYGVKVLMTCMRNYIFEVNKVWRIQDGKLVGESGRKYYFAKE